MTKSIIAYQKVKRKDTADSSKRHWGFTSSPLGTHSFAIGDSLLRHWGLTSPLLGIHSFAIGDSLLRHWGLTATKKGTYEKKPPIK